MKKTKKLTYLTISIMGALAISSITGIALSACTITANGSLSGDGITLPDTWYSKDINWEDATSLNNLLMDKQGIIYSNKYMTEIIAIAPGYGGSTITIPASVKTISGYNKITTTSSSTTKTPTGAFEGLVSLTNVVFAGKNVTQIGSRAFANCTNLQTINFPSSVNIIGDSAFANCASLSSINLNNIQYIGASAFSGAFTNVPYGSIDLNLIQTSFIGASAFSGATGIRNFDLSKNTSLISIGASAFANCIYWNGIIDLSNDNYLSSIGNNAFSGCTGITNIYLSDITPLKTIGDYAFSGCTKLVSIGNISSTSGFIIPSTVSSIGTSAFANTLIDSIDMSQNTATTPLKTSTFKDMPELTSINLGSKITTLPNLLFQNTPKLSEFDLVVPASVTSIQSGNGKNVGIDSFTQSSYSTFHESGFKSIDLSNTSITSTDIGYCYFQGCSNLETVKLKSTITRIRFRAFYNCTALKNVIFVNSTDNTPISNIGFVAPSTLTEIGAYAFYGSGIETVDLSSVTSNIMGTADNTGASTSDSSYSNNYRFANCPSLTSVKLPVSTTFIPSFNFTNDPKLESFNFSDLTNLNTIKGNNFNGTNFSTIDLSKNTSLEKNTFSSNANMFQNLLKNAEVKLPNVITEIKSTNFTYAKPNEDGSGTTTTNLNFEYPNGFGASTTSYDSKILSTSSSDSSSNFSFLTRISGGLDFSNFNNLNGLGRNTLFGNTMLTSLKFSAKDFASGTIGSIPNNNFLGFVGTSVIANNSSTYSTANLPFGSMSGLNEITFKNFTNSESENDDQNEDVMAKTTNYTWNEVARIISSFAKSTSDNRASSVANLSTWTDNHVSVNFSNNSATLSNNNSSLIVISDSTNNGTFTYAGVTWTVNVDSNSGTITISGTGIDTYRAIVASNSSYSNSYKVFFNTKSETSDDGTTTIVPDSNITVTLNIVTNNSSSTPE